MNKPKLLGTTDDDHEKMPIKEFVDDGWLQEANRLFFHPRGLALSVIRDQNGNYVLGNILDARSDPEGYIFTQLDGADEERARHVKEELIKHLAARCDLFQRASVIQPVPYNWTEDGSDA